MIDVFTVADILVENAKKKHGDDVAIIAYYGSHALGTASKDSDLDMFYIPDDGKEVSLYSSFIINGLPFEFWPVSWDFAKRISSGKHCWSMAPSIIANAKVLYARSEEDLERFNVLKKEIELLQKSEGKKTLIELALDKIKSLPFHFDNLNLSVEENDTTSIRLSGFNIVSESLECLTLLNQTYFNRGWASDFDTIKKLSIKPDNLEDLIMEIMISNDFEKIKEAAEELISKVRELLLKEQKKLTEVNCFQRVFDGYYPGIKEYVNKVLKGCHERDMLKVSYAVIKIQCEIATMLAEAEVGIEYSDSNIYKEYRQHYDKLGFPDLSLYIKEENFEIVSEKIKVFDKRAQELFGERSVNLNILESIDDLRLFLKK